MACGPTTSTAAVSEGSTDGALELATSGRVAQTLTTWPPYRLASSAMARWVTKKNQVRLTQTILA
jgi:hypothetical protein